VWVKISVQQDTRDLFFFEMYTLCRPAKIQEVPISLASGGKNHH